MRRNLPDTFLSFPNRVCLSIPLARKTAVYDLLSFTLRTLMLANPPTYRNSGQHKTLKMTRSARLLAIPTTPKTPPCKKPT
jgi:hypothetical protein